MESQNYYVLSPGQAQNLGGRREGEEGETYIYATKEPITMIVYRPLALSPRSCGMPATRARSRFVRSIREMAYIMPRIGRRRCRFCGLGFVSYILSFYFHLYSLYMCVYGWGFGKRGGRGDPHGFLLPRFIDSIHDLVLLLFKIAFLDVQDILLLWRWRNFEI